MNVWKSLTFFSFSMFLRVALPGIVLALGMHHWWIKFYSYFRQFLPYDFSLGFPFTIDLVLDIIISGFVIYIISDYIYLFLEGYHFWPKWLVQWRINRLQDKIDNLLKEDKQLKLEIRKLKRRLKRQGGLASFRARIATLEMKRRLNWEYLRQFPFRRWQTPFAEAPTLLGNLLSSYESYPLTRYGFSGIFLWYYVWLAIGKDNRKAIDDAAAWADAMVLACFSAIVVAVVHFLAFIVFWIGPGVWQYLPTSPAQSGMILAVSTPASWFFWKLSLRYHRNYGQMIRAMFDIKAREILSSLQVPTKEEKQRVTDLTKYLRDLKPPRKRGEKAKGDYDGQRSNDRC